MLSDVSGLLSADAGAPPSRLRVLELQGCRRLRDISVLARLQCLEHLSLAGCEGVSDVACLGSCARLRELELVSCASVDDVSALSACTQLVAYCTA